tara:strand:- start:2676 stop:3923 length:1248 start_codon:yes stop_codon:yes gene_type:complete
VIELFVKKLYELNTADRLTALLKKGVLTQDEVNLLLETKPNTWPDHAHQWIENALGYVPVPVGIVPNVIINENHHDILMAVEETSIIAGINKMNQWIKQSGSLQVVSGDNLLIGQIPFPKAINHLQLEQYLKDHRATLIQKAHQNIIPGLYRRGGGLKAISLKTLPSFHVVEVSLQVCDAMGANLMNQLLHWLKSQIESSLGIKAVLSILSNLQTQTLSKATLRIHHHDPERLARIVQAHQFAKEDPFRAATNNKGIFNGIDAVCLATGNDWRAVEAGGHAFAAQSGTYRPLGEWRMEKHTLVGELSLPLQIGTVGGVTKSHPIAQIALKLMGSPDANQLRGILLSVGLLQNLAALFALTGEGITKGHMRLHIDNLLNHFKLDSNQYQQIKERLIEKVNLGETISHHLIQQMIHG